jgi:hypothetical protein
MPIDPINHGGSASVLTLEHQETIAEELGGDLDAQLAAMLLKQADERRNMTRVSRDALEKQISSLEEEQVAKLRKKAEEIRRAAVNEGWATIVGGAGTAASGVAGLCGDADTRSALRAFQGGAELAAGSGKLMSASDNFAAGQADADATAAEHGAAAAKRELDGLNDEARDARELRRTALEMLAETNRSRAAAYQAALLQRA